MITTVVSIGQFREVHDIDVTTKNGRRCTIDIYKNDDGFDSEVTILDRVSSNLVSRVYKTTPSSSSVADNFSAAVELIKSHISQVDSNDEIQDIHNPCNTPFISATDQNKELSKHGISISVRVN